MRGYQSNTLVFFNSLFVLFGFYYLFHLLILRPLRDERKREKPRQQSSLAGPLCDNCTSESPAPKIFLVIRFVVFSSIHNDNDNYNNNSSLDGFGQFNVVLKYSDESLYFGTFTK